MSPLELGGCTGGAREPFLGKRGPLTGILSGYFSLMRAASAFLLSAHTSRDKALVRPQLRIDKNPCSTIASSAPRGCSVLKEPIVTVEVGGQCAAEEALELRWAVGLGSDVALLVLAWRLVVSKKLAKQRTDRGGAKGSKIGAVTPVFSACWALFAALRSFSARLRIPWRGKGSCLIQATHWGVRGAGSKLQYKRYH